MKKEKTQLLLESGYNSKEFYKKLGSLVFPIALQSFMLSAANAADSLMLTSLSQNALSAVSLANQVSFIYNMIIMSITSGLGIFAAQYWGKKDIESVEKIFGYVFKISIAISVIFGVAALLIPEALMLIFTSDKLLIQDGALYLRYVSPMYFITGSVQIFLCILKNSEKALKATIISSGCVLINVLFNALLIYGIWFFPRLEIKGAAIATNISKVIELLLCLYQFAKKDSVKLRFSYIIKNPKVLRSDYWRISYPFLLNQIIWGSGFTMYSVIMGHLGTDAVASNAMATLVKNLVTCFSTGIAAGTGIMLGNEMGKGNLKLAKVYGGKLCHIALLTGTVMGALILVLIPLVLKINRPSFSDTSLYYLKWMLVMCSYNLIGKSSNVCTNNGVFPSGGDTKFAMYMDLVSMWVVCIPLGLISAFVFHAPVLLVFLLINLDEIIKLPAIYIHYHKYKWLKNLTRE